MFKPINKIKRSELVATLAKYEPFVCGSSRGILDGDNYVLWSYDTKIAQVNTKTNKLEYFDPTNYSTTTSTTTSTLQNAVKKLIADDTTQLQQLSEVDYD